MLDVCLLGTGGMMPLPYRFLTACLMRYNGSSLLIDCGEATQIAIKEKGWTFKPIDVICFTHYHADHISGLPGLLLTMGNAERTEPVTMIGPKGLTRVVDALRTIAPELPFPINYIEIEDPEFEITLSGYTIRAFKVQHRVTCYGYQITIPRQGKFDVERAVAAGVPKKFWNPLQKGQTMTDGDAVYTPDMVLGPERRGIKVVYATDTRPVPVIADMAMDADLMICEGMYGEKEKIGKAKEHRHMLMQESAALAAKAKPRRFWLTHFSPAMNYPEDFMKEIREIYPEAIAGKDGMSVDILFDEE